MTNSWSYEQAIKIRDESKSCYDLCIKLKEEGAKVCFSGYPIDSSIRAWKNDWDAFTAYVNERTN